MKAPSTLNTPIWLTPAEGASYLGTDVTTFLPLLESGQLTLRRSPDQGLRFHRDDLDAVLLPVPPAEAVRLLMAETSETPDELMNPTSHPHRATTPSDDMRSLKEAAVIFEKPYKTLLRLASEGAYQPLISTRIVAASAHATLSASQRFGGISKTSLKSRQLCVVRGRQALTWRV